MANVAKTTHKKILQAIYARILDKIQEATTKNTHFDDDISSWKRPDAYPRNEYALIITPGDGTTPPATGSENICDIEEQSTTIVGVYWYQQDNIDYVDDPMVDADKSMIGYWKPAILAAFMEDPQQSGNLWMPKDNTGDDMLTDPFRIENILNPRRGTQWNVYMQIIYRTNFLWDLRPAN